MKVNDDVQINKYQFIDLSAINELYELTTRTGNELSDSK